MLNFPRICMKSSTSLMELTFLEQKPYGIMETTLQRFKSLVLILAVTLSNYMAFDRLTAYSGAQFLHQTELD